MNMTVRVGLASSILCLLLIFALPVSAEAVEGQRVADGKFVATTALLVALTIADIELTQHCLHKNTCHEGNPRLPTSRAKVYPMQLGLTAGVSYLGYRLKKNGEKLWWLPQVSVASAHGVGVTFGFRFVF